MTQRERRAELLLREPSLARFVLLALLPPVILIVLLSWLSIEYDRSEEVRQQAVWSYDRRAAQALLLSRLTDAETSQRGYLLTGDSAFLSRYEPARTAVRLAVARDVAAHDPAVARVFVTAIKRLVELKFAELDRTIAIAKAGDMPRARTIVAKGEGRYLMDRLHAVIGAMIEHEQTHTAATRAQFISYLEWLRGVTLAACAVLAVALFGLLSAVWRMRRQRYALLLSAFEAAERHATILDSTIDAILILNPSGTVEMMNAAATHLLGYGAGELGRRDISTIMDLAPGDASFHARIGLRDGQLRQSFFPDRTVRRRDGREVAVDVAVGVMSLPSGDHMVVSLRDISERRRMERIKDDVMSTVSHELRTPLTSIVGALGLLRAGAATMTAPEAGRLIEIAENNSRRLIRLINDMLDMDRIRSGRLEIERRPIDLRAMIDDTCVGSEGLARVAAVTLRCHSGDQPVMVLGDADRLVQVLTNLMSNAIRAAPARSEVDLTLSTTIGRAKITVEDRGGGIPAAFRERIFGRFERVEGEAGAGSTGTGLGLAISREIVARHDGQIWFEDRQGGGTRFVVALPLITSGAGDDAAAPLVLVGEEDEACARALVTTIALEGCGYDVVRSAGEVRTALACRDYAAVIVGPSLSTDDDIEFGPSLGEALPPEGAPAIVIAAVTAGETPTRPALEVVGWVANAGDTGQITAALHVALTRVNARKPVILHLDDDRDLLDVVAAALHPEARIVSATDLAGARALLATTSPDVAVLDISLAEGSALDLKPLLIDGRGRPIPTIIYSAQDVGPAEAAQVDAVLVKARGSIPDLKATVRRLARARIAMP